jgi:hypothetical protein
MVALMAEQVASLDRPYVEVSTFLIRRNILIYLRIKNTGRTPASDLSLKIDKNFYRFGRIGDENNLARLNTFNQPVQTFAPGAELIFPLALS